MKILCLFWSNPNMYPFLREKISYLKKKNIKTTFVSRDGFSVHIGHKQRERDDYHENFIKKNCKNYAITGSRNYLIDKIFFSYFLLFSLFIFFINKPDKIFIYSKQTLLILYVIRLFFKGDIVYQNFDYNPEIKIKSLFAKFVDKSEIFLSKYINLFIFSHPKRAQLFSRNSKISMNKIIYVFNSSKLKNSIKTIKTRKNLIWTGSIGPGHSLLNIIKSLTFLDKKIELKIFGKIEDYLFFNKIERLIDKYNLRKRVTINSFVQEKIIKNELMKSYAAIALYEPILTSHKYMAGASAKINSYLANSLPVIVSNNNDFLNFSKKFKASISVDIYNSKSIANGIKKILKKKDYTRLRSNAYKAHKDEFNFIKQFTKINNRLKITK